MDPRVSSLTAFRRPFRTLRATAGDTVDLACHLSPEISAGAREIRWFKGTDCVKVSPITVERGCEGRVTTVAFDDVSLTLDDVKVTDSGQYRCEMLGEKKEEIFIVHLHVSEFRLVSRSADVGEPSCIAGYIIYCKSFSDFGPHVFCGHDATLPCYLSPETSAVAMEIRWFKGTDCIYLYRNGQVTEGRGYEGRVSVFTHQLQRGNVSLNLRDVQRSDYGEYRCEVTHGGQTVQNDGVHLKAFKLSSHPERSFSKSIPQIRTVHAWAGDDVTLPSLLSPETSAVSMEIRWFKGTDCIYLYQNGQVTEGRGYERRVSVFTDELEYGNVSVKLKDVQDSDGGEYRCEVTCGKDKLENNIHLHISELKLVYRSEDVGKPFESLLIRLENKLTVLPLYETLTLLCHGVTLPCYLSPETSAVAMEIRWFKGTDCIYLYQNGQVTEGRGYEGRVSVSTHKLQRGNVSLSLRDVQWSDDGEYRCEVTHGEKMVDASFYIGVFEFHAGRVPAETPKERRRRASESSDLQPKEPEKTGRRWSYEMLPPEL
ncbi:butyrophilin-like protein 2 [Colossoma macropomum]|uniref:butyrophilin-like protein 2 n=1 Tax=Colossoma macropomum TaxID=42526 RepID=UPI0018656A82|nr:butyrophilin-like protein 2 [Colossoma macropomum]